MKPRERREQKQRSGKPRGILSKPLPGKLVDQDNQSAAADYTQHNQGEIRVAEEETKQPSQADIEKITRRMRLMNRGSKAMHAQRKVN